MQLPTEEEAKVLAWALSQNESKYQKQWKISLYNFIKQGVGRES